MHQHTPAPDPQSPSVHAPASHASVPRSPQSPAADAQDHLPPAPTRLVQAGWSPAASPALVRATVTEPAGRAASVDPGAATTPDAPGARWARALRRRGAPRT